MSRVGFGLVIAPKLFEEVVKLALKQGNLEKEVDPYMDDIISPNEKVTKVRNQLAINCLPTKEPEILANATAAWRRK